CAAPLARRASADGSLTALVGSRWRGRRFDRVGAPAVDAREPIAALRLTVPPTAAFPIRARITWPRTSSIPGRRSLTRKSPRSTVGGLSHRSENLVVRYLWLVVP